MAAWSPAGVGKRIKAHRERRGLTQEVLAGLIGKSLSWVRRVEQGTLHVNTFSVLIDVAEVLRCDVMDLTGHPLARGVARQPDLPGTVAAVRDAVMAPGFTQDGEPVPADTLAADLSSAWARWHGDSRPYTAVGSLLPGLLADTRRSYETADGVERVRCAVALATAYHLARLWLKKLGSYDLALLCSDRAVRLARESGEPVVFALSALAMTAVLNSSGHPDEGERVARDAIATLGARLDDEPSDRLLAVYGQLHLVRAISLARDHREGEAWGAWDAADSVSRRIGDYVEPVTTFGVGNVALHAVAIPAELGQASRAVEASRRVDAATVPSVERRSRYLLDVALGYVGQREDVAAAHVLIAAERESPEELRYSTLAGDLVRELIGRDHATIRADLRGLGERIGVLPG